MNIQSQLKLQVAKALRKAAISTLPQINQHLRTSYRDQDFVNSLKSGLLQSQFGLTTSKAQSVTEDIIDEIAQNTKASFVPGTGTILGILRVEIKHSLSSALIAKASYLSNEYTINWLEWVMSEGTKVVVDADIQYGNFPTKSRSGKAIMKNHGNGIFRVDPKYSGTTSDNMISRYIVAQVPEITKLMITGIKNSFK